MAGEEPVFTGMQYYFNSYTKRGRLNWVLATYGTLFLGYLTFGRGKKADKKQAITDGKK